MLGLTIYSARFVVTISSKIFCLMQMRSHSCRGRTPRASAPGSMSPFTATVQMTPNKVSAPLTGLSRRGEETALVKKEFVWWVKVLTSTDSRDLDVSAAIEMSDIYTRIWILLCSFPRESLLPLNLEFFAWHIYIYIYICVYVHAYTHI